VGFRNGVRVAVAAGLVPVLLGAFPQDARPAALPVPQPGYHHLGATTQGTWSGVLGQVAVRDPGVRSGTFDFVATRFMAKASTPAGIKWLEAGWAETGWSNAGQQRIYTFDTNTLKWTFYDQYPVKPGDEVWIELAATGDGAWGAWLWWQDSWHLLTSQRLPIGDHATIEEYVEVYLDPARDGTIAVPPVDVDNVQLKADPDGRFEYWTAAVPTDPGAAADGYCLGFQVPYDNWHAGTC
jgi:hypothetical protein